MRFRCRALVTVLAALAAAVASAARAQEAAPAGTVRSIDVSGQRRLYRLERFHAEQAAAGARLPILIYLHGVGARVTEALPPRYDIPFAAVPGMEPALIVNPQGANRTWDSVPARIRTWRRLSGLDGEPVDDIGFLRALVAELVAREDGDPARV